MGDINVQTLISYTSFNDESGESPDRLVNFKRWLWAIVEKMTALEKQDLVYFWTGKREREALLLTVGTDRAIGQVRSLEGNSVTNQLNQ